MKIVFLNLFNNEASILKFLKLRNILIRFRTIFHLNEGMKQFSVKEELFSPEFTNYNRLGVYWNLRTHKQRKENKI